jgi:hypothetical protein
MHARAAGDLREWQDELETRRCRIVPAESAVERQVATLRLAGGKELKNEFDGQTGPADDWLASQDFGIHDDAFRKRHNRSLTCSTSTRGSGCPATPDSVHHRARESGAGGPEGKTA